MLRLERNLKVKLAPERWRRHHGFFDVVLTLDDVVFDKLWRTSGGGAEADEELPCREPQGEGHAQSRKASPLALQLCRKIQESETGRTISRTVEDFSAETEGPFYVCFY